MATRRSSTLVGANHSAKQEETLRHERNSLENNGNKMASKDLGEETNRNEPVEVRNKKLAPKVIGKCNLLNEL